MNKKIVLAVLLVLVLTLSCSFFVACNDKTPENLRDVDKDSTEYRVFFDDFNGELDTTYWNVHHELRRGGYWDKDQAFTKDGNLVLRTVQKEDGKFYMGAIDTMNKFETHFGYFEAKVLLPKASGIWAAFWLMPQGMMSGNPTSDVSITGAEIDIMESPYYNPVGLNGVMPTDKDTYQCAVHVGDYGANYLKKETFVNSDKVSGVDVNIYDGWHSFGLDWTSEYYRFYYDRQLVFEITDKKYISTVTKDYLFLSIEIGGKNGEAAKPDFLFANSVFENPEGTFPIDFLVDYVAVYSKRPF